MNTGMRKCRFCGYTEDARLEKTGASYRWIEGDVCFACASEAAVSHLLRRMTFDPRLAWLIGPGTRSWELLTAAYAINNDRDVDEFRREKGAALTYQEC
jgi:hypothetical protein